MLYTDTRMLVCATTNLMRDICVKTPVTYSKSDFIFVVIIVAIEFESYYITKPIEPRRLTASIFCLSRTRRYFSVVDIPQCPMRVFSRLRRRCRTPSTGTCGKSGKTCWEADRKQPFACNAFREPSRISGQGHPSSPVSIPSLYSQIPCSTINALQLLSSCSK